MRIGHVFLVFAGLHLVARDIVGVLDNLWLVVRHSLKCIDKVNELKPAIHVFVETSNPINDVCVVDFRRAIVLRKENAQVVRVDFAVRVLINQAEDRQYRVVKPADELLLEELNPLETFNFPITRL